MKSASSTDGTAFNEVERNGETIWVHKTAPVWIVHYSAIEDSQSFRHAFYQPYVATVPLKKGRMVWAHDNKRVGNEGAFRTLEDAMRAAEAAVVLKLAEAA